MNYTVIIILIVLLFVIYQLKSQEKKEGFSGNATNNSVLATCPSGYQKEGNMCKEFTDTPRCPTGSVPNLVNDKYYCVNSEENIVLCPKGYELELKTSTCKKTNPYPACPSGTIEVKSGMFSMPTNRCRKMGNATQWPTCPSGFINPKGSNGEIITERCCPSDKPWYQRKIIGSNQGTACRSEKLPPGSHSPTP